MRDELMLGKLGKDLCSPQASASIFVNEKQQVDFLCGQELVVSDSGRHLGHFLSLIVKCAYSPFSQFHGGDKDT